MASGDNDEMEFQHRRETMTNFQSLQMSNNGGDPFFGSGWDQVVSMSQSQNFGASSVVSQAEVTNSRYPIVMEHQGMNDSSSQYLQYPSSSGFVELVPRLPCFGSGNFTEMVGSFGLQQCSQITSSGCATSYAPNQEACNERTSGNGKQSDEQRQISEDGRAGASPSEKRRKRMSESIYSVSSRKNAEDESQKDASRDGSDFTGGRDDKKLKTEENASPNSRGKQASKQRKEASQCAEAAKENYIHVRARRGQATNSHSLAERVRREKISERMRLLQELVPGCNKITGKAVMLDEIINYVQSLQQQVEFLSMKLATVNPELNIDIERLLSKDILHPQGRNTPILGLGGGINSPHPFPPGVFPASLSNIPSSNAHFPPFPQTAANNDFQSLFQMGYDSGSAINSLGPNSNGH